MNMDYCKYQNTLKDLEECFPEGELDSELSREEKWAKKSMKILILRLAAQITMEVLEAEEVE